MFGVDFSELLVIGVVALIVIGPERLPAVARTLGTLFGRAQRYLLEVKAEIHRDIQMDEWRTLQSGMEDSVRSIEDEMRRELEAPVPRAELGQERQQEPAEKAISPEPPRGVS